MSSDKPDTARKMAKALDACIEGYVASSHWDEDRATELLEPVFAERDALREQVEFQDTSVREKDFEIACLRERVAELEAVVRDLRITLEGCGISESAVDQIIEYAPKRLHATGVHRDD